MLSIGALGSADYYLDEAEYYLGEKELPSGYWLGLAAVKLRLGQVVDAADLKALFAGYSPHEPGRKLVQNAGSPKRKMGWDLTLSAPKSFSIFWALVPQLRPVLLTAHRRAVSRAFSYLDTNAAFTRRGKGGAIREACHLVAAGFEHWTTRADDPGIHTHLLVLNLGLRGDEWRAIHSRDLYRHKMAAGALYRAELAYQVRKELSLAFRRVGRWFELAFISRSVIEQFSTRRGEIVAKVGSQASAVDAAKAAQSTRGAKKRVPLATLFTKWAAQGRALGLEPEAMLLAAIVSSKAPEPGDEKDAFRDSFKVPESGDAAVLWDVVLEKMTGLKNTAEPELSERYVGEASHFSEADLVRHLAEEAVFLGMSADEVRWVVMERLKDLVQLTDADAEVPRYTTWQMLDLEQRLLAETKELAKSNSHDVPKELLKSILDRPDRKLPYTNEQRDAIAELTSGGSDLAILTGFPGTGKTVVLKACRKAWERAGNTVLGASVAGKAALGLMEGSGIRSTTLAGRFKQHDATVFDAVKHHLKHFWRGFTGKKTWRYRAEKITAKTVLVIDEAGMLPTWDMYAVVARCLEVGAKVVFVGDPNQLPPIGAGAPLKCLLNHYASANLEDVMRQRESWARDAVKLISGGHVKAALDLYADRGLIKTGTTEKVLGQLVQDWSATGLKAPRTTLIFAGTRSETAKLNDLCQKARKAARWLPNWPSVRVGEQRFFSGDRVLFTENNKRLKVFNGDLGTVSSINPQKGIVRIKLDRPEGLFIKQRQTVEVPLKYYKNIELGYAVTTHKGQGTTVESAFVLLGGEMAGKELTLVQASRAKGSTAIYIDSTKAGTDLDKIAERLSVASRKDLAVEQLPNAHAKPDGPGNKDAGDHKRKPSPPAELGLPTSESRTKEPLNAPRPDVSTSHEERPKPGVDARAPAAAGGTNQRQDRRPVRPEGPTLLPASASAKVLKPTSAPEKKPETPRPSPRVASAEGVKPAPKTPPAKILTPEDIRRRRLRLDDQLDQLEALLTERKAKAKSEASDAHGATKKKLDPAEELRKLDNVRGRPRGPRL